jgi:hypothetical protein
MSEFDKYDTEKYATKNACCLDKFSNDVMTCCENGSGECVATGTSVYLPSWQKQTCEERDGALVPDWEKNWVSDSIKECCKECK